MGLEGVQHGFKNDQEEKRHDEVAAQLIQDLDLLIAYARSYQMYAAARMIYSAKESIVYWAADHHFHETPQERFVNRNLLDNSLSALLQVAAPDLTSGEDNIRSLLQHILQPLDEKSVAKT